jgi:16S rRNA (guanine966-N2)-methyltransferase
MSLRIIAGAHRGRKLIAPEGKDIRPTSARAREALFNILAHGVATEDGTSPVQGARVLDAFAGTGALGLEALSRGASQVTFVERDPRVLGVLSGNIRATGVEKACVIIRDDFLRAGATTAAFDFVLIDPPYDIASLDDVVARGASWLADRGTLVLEHSRRRTSPEAASSLRRVRLLTAGDSALSFYERLAPLG